jgi:hypothetical protein
MSEPFVEQQRRQRRDRMRAEGIVGIIRASGEYGLVLSGPDAHGAVVLYAMEDGTVRWKQE